MYICTNINLNILKMSKYDEKYLKTQKGRANSLLCAYRQNDKKYGRGECTLTAEWIIDNIFSKPCTHCGETDWHKLGCNRLDNSKPHTPDNVEPCCKECNNKLARIYYKKYQAKKVYQYTLKDELVKVWESARDTEAYGFNQGSVCACCRGYRKTKGKIHLVKQHKGYKWSFKPL